MRSFSRFLPRSHLQKNFAETPEVLRALLIARRSRFFARPRRPDGPRRRFWARKWCPGATFSLRAGARCVLRPKSTKHCAGWRKLRFGPPTLVPKNDENSMLWLFARALAFRTRLGCVPASSGWPAEAPRTRPETLLEPLEAARAVPRALLGPPRRVPDRSWTPLPASAERPRVPQSARRWNFRVFWSFWDRFSSIRTSFSIDFSTIQVSPKTGRRCPQTHSPKLLIGSFFRCVQASSSSKFI